MKSRCPSTRSAGAPLVSRNLVPDEHAPIAGIGDDQTAVGDGDAVAPMQRIGARRVGAAIGEPAAKSAWPSTTSAGRFEASG